MKLLKSMDRLKSRVALLIALHLFIPVWVLFTFSSKTLADATSDENFPDLSQDPQDEAKKEFALILKETQNKLKKVYGPPSPTGSEEEMVISAPKKISKISPPLAVEVTAQKIANETVKPDTLPKNEKSGEELIEEQGEEREVQKAKELEQKLISEREKIKSQEDLQKQTSNKPSTAPQAVRVSDQNLRKEPDITFEPKKNLKAQKSEKRQYGMTVNELDTQWAVLRAKISSPNTPIEYKKLSKDEKKLINSKVKLERQKAKEKMPILDRGYFNEVINRNVLIAQENFLRPSTKSLNDVVARAKEVSVPLRLVKEKEKAATWRARKTLRDLASEFRFEYTDKYGSLGDAFKSKVFRFNFKQPIFHGGNLWNLFREERASLKASKEDLGKTNAKITLDVAEAYLNYSRAYTLFEYKYALAEKVEKYKIQNEEKKKVGAISEIEYLNTDSLIGEIQADLHTAQQELALAQLDLAKHLNLPKDHKLEVESIDGLKDKIFQSPSGDIPKIQVVQTPEMLSQTQDELAILIDQAYRSRPDLRMEEFKLMASRYKEKAVLGKFLPQSDLIVEAGELAEAFEFNNPNPPYQREFKFGIDLAQNALGSTLKYGFDTDQHAPSVSQFQGQNGTRVNEHKFSAALLDNLQQFVDVKEARSQMLEQVVELQEKENEVIKEVKETYYGYHKALIQLDSAIKKMAHKDRVTKLKAFQLEKNQIQLSEYLQAEKDLIDAKNQFAESVAEYYKMQISLNKAIGEADLLRVEGFPFSRREKGKI